MASKYVDMLGNKLKEGDYIAYALTAGRSANMAIYQIIGFNPEHVRPIKVKHVARSYESWRKLEGKELSIGLADQRSVKLKDFKP